MTETATRMAPGSNDLQEKIEGRLYITQSPFYSPAFNGAIFDGPLRLYFSQAQEALAMKFYFEMRTRTQDLAALWPRSGGSCLFIMLYPTEETFDLCFLSQGLQWPTESLPLGRLGRDHVIGLQAHNVEADLQDCLQRTLKVIDGLAAREVATAFASPSFPEADLR